MFAPYYFLNFLKNYLYIFIPVVVFVFLILPFIAFYMVPFSKKTIQKDENGEIKLGSVTKKGISSVVEEDNCYKVKRAENVKKVDLFMFFKVGILAIKKHFYIEFGDDVAVLPKPKKGKLIKIFVTKIDGTVKNASKKRGVSFPFLIINSLLQLAALVTFALMFALELDKYTHSATGNWYSDAIAFYVWPIVISVAIPLLFFAIELSVLSVHGPKKEVK